MQTLATAAEVSLGIAAQPEDQRVKTTQRFLHEGVKHDITVDPNAADPFASFSDHSKGQEVIGAILEGVVGAALAILSVIPATAPFAAPVAAAYFTAQAGRKFAEGDILGGVLSLGSAVGTGLTGLALLSNGTGALAEGASGVVAALGSTAPAIQGAGRLALQATALAGVLSGVAQGAARGDLLGIASGALQTISAVAGRLADTGGFSEQASSLAREVSRGAGWAGVGVGAGRSLAGGDLQAGLFASLTVLAQELAQRVAPVALGFRSAGPAPAQQAPGEQAPGGWDSAARVPVGQESLPAPVRADRPEVGGTGDASLPAPPAVVPASPGEQPATYPFVEPHPTPDGSGTWTNLSDADYYRFKAGEPPLPRPAGPVSPSANSKPALPAGSGAGSLDLPGIDVSAPRPTWIEQAGRFGAEFASTVGETLGGAAEDAWGLATAPWRLVTDGAFRQRVVDDVARLARLDAETSAYIVRDPLGAGQAGVS